VRLVLDSNLFISSLITVDTPPDLLCRQWQAGNFDLITSCEQIAEIVRVTGYAKLQKYFTQDEAADLLKNLHYLSEVVTLGNVPAISKDPADNLIIATALAGAADYLVTGDKRDLLHLGEVEGIPIITARQALEKIEK
jgi:putative PIN family toxin of toxin-antitoxin system